MLYQNSAYWYNVAIEDLKDLSSIEKIEFSFGAIKKHYPSDDVLYENEIFKIRFNQEETLSLNDTTLIQARVKFTNGDVLPTNTMKDNIVRTLSRAEI